MKEIEEKKALDDDLRGRLKAAIEEFKGDFLADHEKAKGSEAVVQLSEEDKKKADGKTGTGAPASRPAESGKTDDKAAEQTQGAAK